MSADNFVAVLRKPTEDGYEYYVTDGNASVAMDDCQYIGHVVAVKDKRGEALEAAHDYADTLPVLEYGVSEGQYPEDEPCGRCYTCILQRGITRDDIPRCDSCGEPIIAGQWTVLNQEGTFHSSCRR